jgi:hypothetical protein
MAQLSKQLPVNVRLEAPAWPEDLAKREHNKLSRDALRETCEFHYRRNLPKHFRSTASTRYGYMPRSEKYRRHKLRKYGSRTDLVKTGLTEQSFTKGPPKIVISGAATSERGFSGRIELGAFPFIRAAALAQGMARYVPKRYRPKNFIVQAAESFLRAAAQVGQRTGVTIDQMRREITAVLPEESAHLARLFLQKYMFGLALLRGRGRTTTYGARTIYTLSALRKRA